jgi:hypothetical protein
MNELPTIKWRNRVWTFDYRLQELRSVSDNGMKTVTLNNSETELLDYALKVGNRNLIRCNMHDLQYKGV